MNLSELKQNLASQQPRKRSNFKPNLPWIGDPDYFSPGHEGYEKRQKIIEESQAAENAAAGESFPAAVETQTAEASPVVVQYYTPPRGRVNMKTLFLVGATVFACWMIFGRR